MPHKSKSNHLQVFSTWVSAAKGFISLSNVQFSGYFSCLSDFWSAKIAVNRQGLTRWPFFVNVIVALNCLATSSALVPVSIFQR